MATDISLKDAVDAEKELYTNNKGRMSAEDFKAINDVLWDYGSVSAKELPWEIRDALGLQNWENIRLKPSGMTSYVRERRSAGYDQNFPLSERDVRRIGGGSRYSSVGSTSGSKETVDVANLPKKIGYRLEGTTPVPVTIDKKGNIIDLPPEQKIPDIYDEKGNKMVLSADRKTFVRDSNVKEKGTLISNEGEIDNDAVKSLINQLNNYLRPKANQTASGTPVGAIGKTTAEMIQGFKEGQINADNPLTRFLSDTKKSLARKLASASDLQPATPEQRALDYLDKNVMAVPYPEKKGLKRYAGIGTFKTPYGQFNIDESGALRAI